MVKYFKILLLVEGLKNSYCLCMVNYLVIKKVYVFFFLLLNCILEI